MINTIIQSIYPLPEQSLAKLTETIDLVTLPKGHLLFKADKIATDIYFIKKGIARAFCHEVDNEVTFWFGMEGDIVLSYNSYISLKPGYENIELLENSELFVLKSATLQALYNEDIHIANWGRKFAEQELIKTEDRFISSQSKNATTRYTELINTTPDILKRVQLGYIASYLGITQVSLSRIRAVQK